SGRRPILRSCSTTSRSGGRHEAKPLSGSAVAQGMAGGRAAGREAEAIDTGLSASSQRCVRVSTTITPTARSATGEAAGGHHAEQPAGARKAGRRGTRRRVERTLPAVLLEPARDLDVGLEVDDRPPGPVLEKRRIDEPLDQPIVELHGD